MHAFYLPERCWDITERPETRLVSQDPSSSHNSNTYKSVAMAKPFRLVKPLSSFVKWR